MPDTSIVTQLAALFRADLDAKANDATQQMAGEWLKVEQRLEADILLLATELANPPGGLPKLDPMAEMVKAMIDANYPNEKIKKLLATQGIFQIPDVTPQAKVKQWQLARLQRYVRLLAQVQAEIEKYTGKVAEPVIQKLQNDSAYAGLQHALSLIDATITSGGGDAIGFTFDRLGVEAVQNIVSVAGAGKPLGDLLQAAYPLVANGITDKLIEGTALGWNPRKTARSIIADGLSQGLNHILLVSRDQQIRSYREASRQQYAKSGIQQYRRLAAKQSRTCFLAGTKIRTNVGDLYIEDITPGVLVLTRQGYRPVVETMARQVRGCFTSLIHGEGQQGKCQQVVCTSGHLLWVESKSQWRRACDIFVGEHLLTPDGPSLVKKVKYFQDRTTVYNLEVEEAHEYFADGVLAHNCLACLALDGSVWEVAELMPLHPQDRCLLPGQFVETGRGPAPIEEIEPGDEVQTHVGRLRPVIATNVSHYRGQVVRITDGGRTLLCTPEHRLLTLRGWVEAGKLRPDDELVGIQERQFVIE